MAKRKKPAPKRTAPKKPKPKKPKPAKRAVPAKAKRPKLAPKAAAYERRKSAAAARNLEISAGGREIGTIPPVEDPKRRARCERDALRFLATYFPSRFPKPFGPDHLEIIKAGERDVLEGGQDAYAMPRHSGKTTITEALALFAVLNGHRHFVLIVGADKPAADEILDSIKAELECNPLLIADYPECCYPIARLEGIANRCKGQTCQGERTRIAWTKRYVILPTIAGSRGSGAAIKTAGITGRIRGPKITNADGQVLRPDFCILDDVQTDQSAASPILTKRRKDVVAGAVLGLGGPGVTIAVLMACTVIAKDDLSDQLLDRGKHPEWNGHRCKMLYAWPARMDLWDQYREIRAEGIRAGDRGKAANAFYAEHRAEMDEGARVGWEEDFQADELSAIQHAMNLWIDDPEAFAAERQNEPLRAQADDVDELTVERILARACGIERRLVPIWATRLTAFVDVQLALLYWMAVAWGDDFTGLVVDYGTWPPQQRSYFTLREADPTLQSPQYAPPASSLEGQLRAGLDELARQILGREWRREDAASARVTRCLVDANWGESTETVYEFCRRSPYAAALMPSHGKGVGAAAQPLNAARKLKQGERLGVPDWFMPLPKRAVRHILFDANAAKNFVAARFKVAAGGHGRLDLFGTSADHRLLADHVTAEQPDKVTSERTCRTVTEWRLRQQGRDNHWLDCLVGCAVAASVEGARLEQLAGGPPPKPKRVSFAEQYRAARERQEKRA